MHIVAKNLEVSWGPLFVRTLVSMPKLLTWDSRNIVAIVVAVVIADGISLPSFTNWSVITSM